MLHNFFQCMVNISANALMQLSFTIIEFSNGTIRDHLHLRKNASVENLG